MRKFADISDQQRKSLEETKAMFPRLRQDIQEAKSKLEAQLVSYSSTVVRKSLLSLAVRKYFLIDAML